MKKPSIPKGTRDFGPQEVRKRNYIINTIRKAYEQFGFEPLETPVMEKLEVLMGKYGEEGDKLLYRILNQADFLKKANKEAWEAGNSKRFALSISTNGLRYDLTIPFARYVVMNQSKLTFPFKRYQIQAVWRGDRPKKGRYREFYQCDADIVGSNSLLNEVELVQIFNQVYDALGFPVTLRLNNRKILAGIAETAGINEQLKDMTIAIDKLDKIGMDGVIKELEQRNITPEAISIITNFLTIEGDVTAKIAALSTQFTSSEIGQKGIAELQTLFDYIASLDIKINIDLDLTLARGLDYYTGTIYEVIADDVPIGSISGGGRYDNLTGTFGLPNTSGVGISFGLDRIYDVMEELNLFGDLAKSPTKVMFVNFGGESEKYAFKCLQMFRQQNIPAEIFPDATKMKKQMRYANNKQIPFVIFTGSTEMEQGLVQLKNMESGEQQSLSMEAVIALIKNS